MDVSSRVVIVRIQFLRATNGYDRALPTARNALLCSACTG